jgi:hypothetical protein
MDLENVEKKLKDLQNKKKLKRREGLEFANNIVKAINDIIQVHDPIGSELVDLYRKAALAYEIASTKVPLKDRDNVAFPSNYWSMRCKQTQTTVKTPTIDDNSGTMEMVKSSKNCIDVHDKVSIMNQDNSEKVSMKHALNDIIISRDFRKAFRPLLNSKDLFDKSNCLNSIEDFMNSKDAAYIFKNEFNIEYFLNKILIRILELDLIDDFKNIGINIDISIAETYRFNECCDILIFINFCFPFLKLDLNSTYINKYVNMNLKEAAVNWKSTKNSQYGYMRMKEKSLREILAKSS